ncbi:MAG: acyltransferase [Pseudohongiella sp.]|nr:acyltransferase [Pseudohongiella sp.]
MIGCDFIFESDCGQVNIGNGCFINSGTKFISRSSITIGNNVTIAWGCTLYDHNSHSLDYEVRRNDIAIQVADYKRGRSFTNSKNWEIVKSRPIIVDDDVWIGFNVIILSGVTIGEGAVIGAGSVVRENVEPWTIVAGNPAVVVKRLK